MKIGSNSMTYQILYNSVTESAYVIINGCGNIKKMISCFIGLFKMWRFIDKNYDAAKETYAKRYTELTSMNFWRKYLEL